MGGAALTGMLHDLWVRVRRVASDLRSSSTRESDTVLQSDVSVPYLQYVGSSQAPSPENLQ